MKPKPRTSNTESAGTRGVQKYDFEQVKIKKTLLRVGFCVRFMVLIYRALSKGGNIGRSKFKLLRITNI